MTKNVLFQTTLALVCGSILPTATWAQESDWPTRTITINVGHAAGGSYDAMARRLAADVGAILGQTVVVTPRAGAGGVVMAQAIGLAKPDGYQLGFSTSQNVALDAQAGIVPFDAKTVEPLISVARVQSVLVTSTKKPFNDMAGLIEYTKKKGYAQFAQQALVDEFVVKSVMEAEGVQFDFIPYKGGAEIRFAVIQGQTDFGYVGGGYKADVDNGVLKILATTDPNPLPHFPGVPTLKELGYPVTEESVGLFIVPAGTPESIKEKLASAIEQAANTPAFKSFLSNTLYMVPDVRRGDALKSLLNEQESQWARLLAESSKKPKK